MLAAVVLSSCKQDGPMPSGNAKTFADIFETFWAEMNSNYVFWDIDKTSWDEQYRQYKPLFDQLDINNRDDIEQSVIYFTEMTKGIVDGHYSIQYTTRYLIDNEPVINPAFERKHRSPDYRPRYDYSLVVKNYLDDGYKSSDDKVNIIVGRIHGDILYLYFNSCHLYQVYLETPIVKLYLDELKDPSLRGVIIDVRGNPGGDISDLNFVVGSFVESPATFGSARYKYDVGRFDLTPWSDVKINPLPGTPYVDLPVVVLADGYTGSTAELITAAIQSLPAGTFIGETTYGATGLLTPENLYNDGSFSVGDFMTVQTASSQFRTIDNRIIEGIGATPDITTSFNLDDLNSGHDEMLERAIGRLSKE
jgi:hypothetical protein